MAGECPHCGGPVPAGVTTCPWCNTNVPAPWTPPSLDFTRPPVRSLESEPATDEYGEESGEGYDEEDDEDDETYWSVWRVVQLILALILVIIFVAEISKGG